MSVALVLRERWAVDDPVLDCAIFICDMYAYRAIWGTGDEDEGECQCIRVDVDLNDSYYCGIHGPNSSRARALLEREAAAEAAFWQGVKEF